MKLVYLDAAYDHVHSQSLYSNAPPVDLGLDFRSFPAYIKTFKKLVLVWSPAYEADARNEYVTASDGRSVVCVTPGSIFKAVLNGTCELDYLKVNAPALAFFALDDPDRQRLFAKAHETEQRREQVFEKSLDNFKQAQIKRFRLEVKNSRIIEMPNTSHYCFIQRQDEVVRQMRAFLEATPANGAQIIQSTNTLMN